MDLGVFDGSYRTDPTSIWRALLDSAQTVHYADDLGMWLITGYREVREIFGDSETFANALTLAPVYEMCPKALQVVAQIEAPPTTAAADAPVHPRTRKALRAVFGTTAKAAAEQYGQIVEHRVTELVSRLVARTGQTVDLIPEFTAVLPLLVIVDILGVPAEDIPRIKRWSDGQIALIWGLPSPQQQVELAQGLLEFWRYCRSLVTGRLSHAGSGTDFVSRALRYRDGDDATLTLDEVASLAFNLLVAGHETTAGLLTHGLDQALSVPDRWNHLVHNPDDVSAFVEETLRFGPAIDGWTRVTTKEITVGSTTIPAGARCLLLIGAANRDAAVFPAPDAFDPRRVTTKDHLSFGYGVHYCVGAALARLEAGAALRALAAALPGLRLASEHRTAFHPNVAFPSHRSLSVVIAPAV
ncbi:cytochrome P450 [Nocardia sp. NPDC049220]|uniref:cytochrome P450 n=1 Tax=Nocardia sp. NPDC049220 TaxID=3155273 RepID=UPI00340F0059